MADVSRIKEALSKLDTSNDNHWTAEGLPRIDTVKMLAGDQSLTREDITKAAPDFTRESAAVPDDKATVPDGKAAGPVTTDDAENVAPAAATPDAGADPVPTSELEAAVATATKELQDAHQAVIAAQKEMDAKQLAYDAAVDALEESRKVTGGNPIRGYLDAQRIRNDERAAQQRSLSEAGLSIKKLSSLFPSKTPLDLALARKR